MDSVFKEKVGKDINPANVNSLLGQVKAQLFTQ